MKIFKKDNALTAERAWVETTYGRNAWRPIEQRISDKQKQIKDTIEGKYSYSTSGGNTISLKSYRCVIDFEEDLKNHIEEILKPFYDGGFDIINLSHFVPEFRDENVFLISWRHIFDKDIKSSSKSNILQDEADERMICD